MPVDPAAFRPLRRCARCLPVRWSRKISSCGTVFRRVQCVGGGGASQRARRRVPGSDRHRCPCGDPSGRGAWRRLYASRVVLSELRICVRQFSGDMQILPDEGGVMPQIKACIGPDDPSHSDRRRRPVTIAYCRTLPRAPAIRFALAPTLARGIAAYEELRPDVVLVDHGLPDGTGIAG
jgi:hypothetical protein